MSGPSQNRGGPFHRGSWGDKCRILIFFCPCSYHTSHAAQGQRLFVFHCFHHNSQACGVMWNSPAHLPEKARCHFELEAQKPSGEEKSRIIPSEAFVSWCFPLWRCQVVHHSGLIRGYFFCWSRRLLCSCSMKGFLSWSVSGVQTLAVEVRLGNPQLFSVNKCVFGAAFVDCTGEKASFAGELQGLKEIFMSAVWRGTKQLIGPRLTSPRLQRQLIHLLLPLFVSRIRLKICSFYSLTANTCPAEAALCFKPGHVFKSYYCHSKEKGRVGNF